jgi:hypothetical protein
MSHRGKCVREVLSGSDGCCVVVEDVRAGHGARVFVMIPEGPSCVAEWISRSTPVISGVNAMELMDVTPRKPRERRRLTRTCAAGPRRRAGRQESEPGQEGGVGEDGEWHDHLCPSSDHTNIERT